MVLHYATKIVGNVSFEVVDNQELSGINSEASKVGKITNTGANWENAFFNLDTPIDFTTDKGIKLKLYSDQALPIKLKFEDGTEAPVEVDVNHTGTGWEELIFTFLSTASYNDMIIFVDGPGTAAGTFYIDDIEQVAGDVGEPCVADTAQSFAASSFNISFETDPGTTDTVGETDKLLLGDVGYEYVDNPDFDNAVNSSCKVAKIDKAGGLNYANVQIFTADKFNFTDNAGFKLKIFSPNVGTNVLFKLEDTNNGGVFNQVSQLTTIANGWEELTFDFPESDTNKFDRIIIFFGFEQGDALTVHFDDLMLYGTGSGGGGASGDYIYATSEAVTITSTIEDWGSGTTIVTDYSGDGTYNPCIQLTSGTAWGDVSALAFTGMETGILSNYSTLAFKIKTTDYTTIRVKVPENEIGFNIADGTPLADGWVQMSLPLSNWSNEVAAADQFAILEFGAGTILITDVMLSGDGSGGGGGGGDCPAPPAGELLSNGDFEAGEVCWQFFPGTSISTTVNNGGSNSAEIQGTTGAAVGLKQERFATGSMFSLIPHIPFHLI